MWNTKTITESTKIVSAISTRLLIFYKQRQTWDEVEIFPREHSFSKYAKLSEKVTFLTFFHSHVRMRIWG